MTLLSWSEFGDPELESMRLRSERLAATSHSESSSERLIQVGLWPRLRTPISKDLQHNIRAKFVTEDCYLLLCRYPHLVSRHCLSVNVSAELPRCESLRSSYKRCNGFSR